MLMSKIIEESTNAELCEWESEKIELARKALLMEKGVIDPAIFIVPDMPALPTPAYETAGCIQIGGTDHYVTCESLALMPNHPRAEEARKLLSDAVATGAVALKNNEWLRGIDKTVVTLLPADKISASTIQVISKEEFRRWSDETETIRARRSEITKLTQERDKAKKTADKEVEFFFARLADARAEKERADRALRMWTEYLGMSGGEARVAYRFLVASLGETMVREAATWHPEITDEVTPSFGGPSAEVDG